MKKNYSVFCANGGKILATGKSTLRKDNGGFCVDLGARYIGGNPYNPDYFRPIVKIDGMGDTGYIMYGKGEK